nr:hypothetical protein [Pedobacter sp. ASV19]
MNKNKIGPVGLYLLWIVICLIFALLVPVLSSHSDSSAEVPFVIRTYAIIALVLGLFIISLLNIFIFKEWVRRYWYINGIITILAGSIIVYFLVKILNQ